MLRTQTHHDGVNQRHDVEGPHGAEAGEDDQDEVILGLGGLLHSGVAGGRAAQAHLGRRERRGGGQLPDGARPQRHTVAVLVGVQALVRVHVHREGGGCLHAVATSLRGERQEFFRLLEVRGWSASAALTHTGAEEVDVRVDGHLCVAVMGFGPNEKERWE